MALANDGGATEVEAELAMAKAQELMAEHNLTMAALEAAGGQGERRQRLQHEKKLMFVWKRELLQTIAKVNFCYIALTYASTRANETNVVGYTLIGRESNVVAVRNMFHYLLDTIERLIVAEFGTTAPARGSRSAHSFRLGASDRLKDRLVDRHERKLAEQEREANERQAASRHPGAATGNALVVVLRDYAEQESELNDDMRLGREPGTTTRLRLEDEANWRQRRGSRRRAGRPAGQEQAAEDIVTTEPDYDAEMKLPEGKTCDDCHHADRCFRLGFSKTGSTSCDFYPSCFRMKKGEQS